MRYDLHLHTKYSKCSTLKPEILLKIAKKRKLDGIAVTDHNSMEGGRVVSKLNKDKDFEVIIGNEIKTQYGDVLVYYLQEDIKTKDFFGVVDKVKEQDAIISIAHPFRPLPHVRFNYPIDKVSQKIDAIECINARTFYWENKKAEKIASDLGLAKTAGSDSHFDFEIGRAVTIFEGDLKEAVRKRKTNIEGSSSIVPIGPILSFIKKRILG